MFRRKRYDGPVRIANLLLGAGNQAYPGLDVPARFVPPGVDVHRVESGVYVDPRDPASRAVLAIGMTAAAVRAAREGFDAAFINSTNDDGLREIRSIVRMPVAGAGEAGLRAAASLGRRFAIVQVWPEWSRWIDEEQLQKAGVADRCCAIRNVCCDGEEDEVHAAMMVGEPARRDEMIARIADAMAAAVTEDGADAIMLGCTCMSAAAEELASRVDVPLVDPMVAGYLAAEQLARLGARSIPLGKNAEHRDRLASIFDAIALVLEQSGSAAGNQIESCVVCAPTHAVATGPATPALA